METHRDDDEAEQSPRRRKVSARRAKPRPLITLFAREGESFRDCIRRHGHDVDDETRNFHVVLRLRERRTDVETRASE